MRADRAMTRRTTARRDRRASTSTRTSRTPATTAAMSDGVKFTSPTIRRRLTRLAYGRRWSVLLDGGEGGDLELARDGRVPKLLGDALAVGEGPRAEMPERGRLGRI